MRYYIAVDIGGTAIKYGVLREDGSLVLRRETPTHAAARRGPGIVSCVERCITELLQEYPAEGICISTAGMVNPERGEIFYSAPLIPDWAGTRLKAILETKFHLPCEVENDVNCAGLAESRSGAGKGKQFCLCLTVGTGIGGCLVMDGKVYHGAADSALEVGYLKLPGGDFQDLASTKSLVEKVERIQREKQLPSGNLNGKIIFDRAKDGDETCIRAINEMTDTLGMGIANLCYVLNPDAVILGGGIMAQEAYLKPRIEAALKRYLLPTVAANTALLFAAYRNEAGMLGAFYHFIDKQKERTGRRV